MVLTLMGLIVYGQIDSEHVADELSAKNTSEVKCSKAPRKGDPAADSQWWASDGAGQAAASEDREELRRQLRF